MNDYEKKQAEIKASRKRIADIKERLNRIRQERADKRKAVKA